MYLLIDIGNENTKWRFGTKSDVFSSSQPEYSRNLWLLISELSDITGVIFVNVADHNRTVELERFVREKLHVPVTQVVSAANQCGVRNSYRKIKELGADRWATLIGVRSIYPGASIIVDSGTAITVDALSADGEFLGGSILPGFSLAQTSLWQRASGIDMFHALMPELPARSTIESVSSGVVYAIAGGVDRLVRQYCELLDDSPNLLLTGGGASLIAQHSTHHFEERPNLTLTGLDIISKTL